MLKKKAGVGTYGSTSKKWTFDLNGYTISNPPSVDPNPMAALFYVAGDITFVGNGGMNADPPRMISQQIGRDFRLSFPCAVASLLYIFASSLQILIFQGVDGIVLFYLAH